MQYLEWLGPNCSVHLITEARAVAPADDTSGYASVSSYSDYLYNPSVELKAIGLHQTENFVEVIAMSEFDLIRAARLREQFGIEGQSLQSALAFRDKFTMKSMLRAAEIPVADFAAVDSIVDLLQFVERFGYPVVLKPRRGAASLGVTVLRSLEHLQALAAVEKGFRGDAAADLLAEVFIDHQLVHVDGVIFEERVIASWPSYSTPGLGFHERHFNRSTMFEREDPNFDSVTKLVHDTLRALPTPRVTIFHAEVFIAKTGKLFLNEIASRMGGGRIKTMWQAAFGINLEEWHVRNSSRMSKPVLSEFLDPLIGAFSDYPAPENGYLLSAAQDCDIPGVYKFKLEVPVGTYLDTPTSIGDVIGSSTAACSTAAEVNSLLDIVDSWFLKSISIGPSELSSTGQTL